jgi:DNA replication protein DnaC
MDMITEQTYEKMKKMRMNHMAQVLRDMDDNESIQLLPFDERIGLLIDTEWDFKQNNKSQTLTKKAGFIDSNACVEGIDYKPERNINKNTIFQLSTCDYIKARKDVLILGKTGVGKSYIAQALGNSACRNHITTRYIATSDLFDELAVATETGEFKSVLDSYIKPSLLILDDHFLTKPTNADNSRLCKLVEKRMHIGSTIYCSQLKPEEWHERIDEKIIADSILDRIVNRSYHINLEGDSMRKALRPEV